MDETPATKATTSQRLRAWPFLKWGLFVVVIYFIGRRAVALWKDSPPADIHVHVLWLIPAAAMYLVGWLPSVWFWRAMLRRMHQRVGWIAAIRAYYVGSIGKYMPGKALVLVMRGTMLKDAGASPFFAGVTAVYETLIFMASGTALALALAPLTFPESFWRQVPDVLKGLRQQTLLLPIVVIIATIGSAPLSAWLFTLVGRKALPHDPTGPTPPGFTTQLLIQGVLITSLGWMCHAVSLACTIQAVSNQPLDWRNFPIWLATACVSTVGGFVILVAPGGLGVREWLIVEMLKDQPAVGPAQAVVIAGLLRAVWFVAELAAAGALYLIKPASAANSSEMPKSAG